MTNRYQQSTYSSNCCNIILVYIPGIPDGTQSHLSRRVDLPQCGVKYAGSIGRDRFDQLEGPADLLFVRVDIFVHAAAAAAAAVSSSLLPCFLVSLLPSLLPPFLPSLAASSWPVASILGRGGGGGVESRWNKTRCRCVVLLFLLLLLLLLMLQLGSRLEIKHATLL